MARVMLPLLMGKGRPRWWWRRSSARRRLGVVAAWGFAVAAALVVSLCFVGGALASVPSFSMKQIPEGRWKRRQEPIPAIRR
nr:unnamed protein product [Digitaria exilis]